jgi:hypothetical protein
MNDKSEETTPIPMPEDLIHRHPFKGGWNCRILLTRDESGEAHYGIHEVFYGADGRPAGWACGPCHLEMESKEELLKYLENVNEAVRKPVLDPMTMTDLKEDA